VPDDGDNSTRVVLITADGREAFVLRLPAGRPGLHVVELLARLRLSASRCGGRLVLRGDGADLRALLELVGLAGVLDGHEVPGVVVEHRLQPEGAEQLGVEEVVHPGDPPR